MNILSWKLLKPECHKGTEVKSLRAGKANFTDAFAFVSGEEVWLKELHISSYDQGSYMNHEPKEIASSFYTKKYELLIRGYNRKDTQLFL